MAVPEQDLDAILSDTAEMDAIDRRTDTYVDFILRRKRSKRTHYFLVFVTWLAVAVLFNCMVYIATL
jgi:hypothetical protein